MGQNLPTEREARAMVTESGWLGRCFGSRRSAPVNIACAALAGFLALGAALTFVGADGITATEYWAEVKPMIALIFGYLFAQITR